MRSRKAGLPFATQAQKRELSIREVRIENESDQGGAIQKVRDIYGGGWVIFGVKSKKYLCTFWQKRVGPKFLSKTQKVFLYFLTKKGGS